ncbi:hypothetical protein [uncultured Jatrophihabitans sp.]|uniref:hypothetical protein n=1 Tax=uncultured Jatrophihabitans sp. TaxID=1610747 RepID=UPI0035C9CD14
MICEESQGPDSKIIFATEHLVGYASRVYPWGVIVATQRHDCDGPWALNDAEAVELGRLVPRLSGAIRRTGSPATYIVAFNEELPLAHFHIGFLSRYLPLSEAEHVAMHDRVEQEAVDPVQVAADVAAELRAQF